jgi:hypothetical protein
MRGRNADNILKALTEKEHVKKIALAFPIVSSMVYTFPFKLFLQLLISTNTGLYFPFRLGALDKLFGIDLLFVVIIFKSFFPKMHMFGEQFHTQPEYETF